MRVLSGIQPTGRFHWGNYFGAIRQYIDLQHEDAAYYFIANLHALTTVRDPAVLRQLTLDAAIDLLALGLESRKGDAVRAVRRARGQRTVLAADDRHADGPAGTLPRLQGQEGQGLTADAGLFTYPVLMAADILAYDSDTVPVGDDQVQHIEVCRDLAASFNHHFGQTFVMPKAKVLEHSAKVPGIDGEKMSKSYNNTLEMFEDPKAQRKKIMRIVTDSRPMEQPKEPDGDHLFQLFSLVAEPSRARRNGGPVSPRRLRLRRSEKSAGRRCREIFRRAARPPRRIGGPSGKSARNPGRRRREGPQKSRRSVGPCAKGLWNVSSKT